MTRLAFVDTETTGLDPDRHEIWEVGLIVRHENGAEDEYVWQLPVDLSAADPMALKIGRFHDRRWRQGTHGGGISRESDLVVNLLDMPAWAEKFARLTHSAHLVGAVVSFDEERLRRLLRRNGQCPMWHHHLIDVENLAAGWLAGRHGPHRAGVGGTDDRYGLRLPPWDSEDLSRAVGIDPDGYDRHTALGDALWARDIYDAVMETR